MIFLIQNSFHLSIIISFINFLNVSSGSQLGWSGILIPGHTSSDGSIYIPSCIAIRKKDNFDFDNSTIYPAAASIKCQLFISGGYRSKYISDIVKYDPVTDTSETWMQLSQARIAHSMHRFDDENLVICGGWHRSAPLNSCEICNIAQRGCHNITNLPLPIYYHSSLVFRNELYIIGGMTGTDTALSSIHSYNVVLEEWTQLTSMSVARPWHPGVAYLDPEQILVCGGTNQTNADSCEIYDIPTDQWRPAQPMNVGRSDFGLVAYDKLIYAVGGYNGSMIDTVESYSRSTGQWTVNSRRLWRPTTGTNVAVAIHKSCE